MTCPFVRAAILNQGTNGIDQSRLQQVLEPPVNVLWNLGCYECVAHRSMRALSTTALESAQIPVTAMVLGETMGHAQAQVIPPLEPRADAALSAVTGRVAAREPPGVLPAGSGR